MLKKNLRKQVKLIMFYLMIKEKLVMINLVMLHFKVLVAKEVLVILIFLLRFQIFLKMSLEI